MKFIFLLLTGIAATILPGWLTNFNEAQKIAKEKNEYILLNFSRSDWSNPSTKLCKKIFESRTFENYAVGHLVLVNADFPGNKKNKLPDEQVKHNEMLADKYNRDRKFPYTLLLTSKGDILKEWEGYPDIKPEEFVKQIILINENRN